MAGIEHIYSDDELVDYLSYDDALAVASESVVEHASKASQEHFGEPRSISGVMRLEPEEREQWLKAAQDEIQSLVENVAQVGLTEPCSTTTRATPPASADSTASGTCHDAPWCEPRQGPRLRLSPNGKHVA